MSAKPFWLSCRVLMTDLRASTISCCLPSSVDIETSILHGVGQGPPAVCDSPLPTASRRNRENPAPLPTRSKVRQAYGCPTAIVIGIDARLGRGFVSGYPGWDVSLISTALWDNRRC